MNRLVVVTKLNHYVTFCLQDAVKDQFVFEEGITIIREISDKIPEHLLDRFMHFVYDDFFDSFKLLVHVVYVKDVVLALLFIVQVKCRVVLVDEVALLKIVFFQHIVHHALVFELDCINHTI